MQEPADKELRRPFKSSLCACAWWVRRRVGYRSWPGSGTVGVKSVEEICHTCGSSSCAAALRSHTHTHTHTCRLCLHSYCSATVSSVSLCLKQNKIEGGLCLHLVKDIFSENRSCSLARLTAIYLVLMDVYIFQLSQGSVFFVNAVYGRSYGHRNQLAFSLRLHSHFKH